MPFVDTQILRERRQQIGKATQDLLLRARAEGREQLNPGEEFRYRQAMSDLAAIDEDLDRIAQTNRTLSNFALEQRGLTAPGGTTGRSSHMSMSTRTVSTAGQLCPLNFDEQELRRLQSAALRGENARIETRNPGFSSADPLLPAELFPYPVAAQHESRLLDRLPGYAIESPSVTFIRHVSTTGEAAATTEGSLKPELIFNTDALTATAVKLAANNAVSYEIISDWPAFSSYCGTELYKRVIDVENAELIQGNAGAEFDTGTSVVSAPSGMTGMMNTPGILEYDASADTGGTGASSLTPLDSFEKALAQLRTGPALAVADLCVLHPDTWSAIRRVKDSYGRFMVAPDPTSDQASELWGVDVLQTTQQPPGYALLLDTSKLGYVAIRESLSMRIGWSGDDFTRNLLRTVAEERLVLCVTRPPAILVIEGLPTS
jgi:HK97 family phage major capsid protein